MNKERNYELLKEKNPYLYERLLQHHLNSEIEPVLCQGGGYTLKVTDVEGKKILLNSKYGLERDIQEAVDSIDYRASLLIWIGFGMGHGIVEILRRKDPIMKIVIIEPRLDILKAAMEYGNTENILTSNDCYLFGGTSEETRIQFLNLGILNLVYHTGHVVFHQAAYAKRCYSAIDLIATRQVMEDVVKYGVQYIGNHPEDSLLGINHFFSNMHAILKSPGLSMLKDRYQGYPAICIAAGPSLDKNIHLLKEVQNKALIFCADAVWEKLMRLGIIPDAISSLERDKGTYRLFFENKIQDLDAEKTCLLAQSFVYPKTLQEFEGIAVVCTRSSVTLEEEISKCIPSLNSYSTGNSCAHMSFGIAKALGCNPIIVIGQDLAYSEEGISHARDTYGENMRIEDFLDQGRKKCYIENITRTGLIESDQFFNMFRQWFEAEVAEDDSTTYINATEGGAYIAGMQVMKLQEVIDKYLLSNAEKVRLIDELYKVKAFIDQDQLQRCALKYCEQERSSLRAIDQEFNKLLGQMNTLNDFYVKCQSSVELDLFVRELQSILNELDRIVKVSAAFEVVVQYYVFLYRRFFYAHRHIRDIDELLNMFHFTFDIMRKMEKVLQQTLIEYERGLTIIQNNGVCDTIDTPLMGEMYD